ncbi:centromere protein I [Rhynchocyon petersi]
MSAKKRARNSQVQSRISGGRLSEEIKGKADYTERVLEHGQGNPEEDYEHAEDALQEAVRYFERGRNKTSQNKGVTIENHLKIVETVAWKNGLNPEDIDILLNVALSGKLVNAISTRILKSLIPATVISGDSVVHAVSWLCVGKCSGSIKVLFFRWLVTMFDFINGKDQVNMLYGFFFASLQDEELCPYVCHFLYLLTRKENVKPFRVRKLLDLQAKMGMQPHLQALLSLYKLFVPTLISVSLPSRKRIYFKNSETLWQSALITARKRNLGPSPSSLMPTLGSAEGHPLRKKWKSSSVIPKPTSSSHIRGCGMKEMSLSDFLSYSGPFPLEQLHNFHQLLENIHHLELPCQMSSVLNNSLLLHYINCVEDESLLLRFYHWLNQALQEECTWYKMNNDSEKEFTSLLDSVIRAQCFLQEGFYSCEAFLYKSLPLWNGFCCRSQFLQLVSWIPFSNFSDLKPLVFEHLAHLFFTSTIYFKCSVLQSLKELLQNWLLLLSMDLDTKSLLNSPLEETLGGTLKSLSKFIHYVENLSTNGMRLENNSIFLLHFILDFYETVSDIFINYNLPLVVLFPRGVFYPALFSLDVCTLNHLGYIMYRYRINLIAAKKNELVKKAKSQINFSSKICQDFNQYLRAMVGCLWISKPLQRVFYHEIIDIDPEILREARMPDYKSSLNLIHHPAVLSYAVSFLQEILEKFEVKYLLSKSLNL